MTETAFTVIVPTRDRPERLAACLAAVRRLAFPRERFEVVVVDDGSRVPVASGDGWRLVRLEGRGPAAARNAGARAARGRWLAFTDDDCRPRPDWLGELAARLAAHPDAMVGGRTVNALTDNPWSEASQLLVDWLYDWLAERHGSGRFFTTSNMALPREPFLALGGFDESFPAPGAEDRDLCERWAAAGLAAMYAPEAIVDHAHELDALSYWRQHVRYGRGARRLWGYRSGRGGRQRMEPVTFYTGMLEYPFRRGARNPLPLSLLLALSQVANAAGYASQWMEERRQRLSDPPV
jgi:GT2 family glycosyltransferase